MGANIFIKITKYSIEVFKTRGTFVMEKDTQIESVPIKGVGDMDSSNYFTFGLLSGLSMCSIIKNSRGKSTYVVSVPGCVLLYSKKAVSSVCFGGCAATSDSVPYSKMTYCCSGR